jgi:hypothetical protein
VPSGRQGVAFAVSRQFTELIQYMRQWNSKPPIAERRARTIRPALGSEAVANRAPTSTLPIPHQYPTGTELVPPKAG